MRDLVDTPLRYSTVIDSDKPATIKQYLNYQKAKLWGSKSRNLITKTPIEAKNKTRVLRKEEKQEKQIKLNEKEASRRESDAEST